MTLRSASALLTGWLFLACGLAFGLAVGCGSSGTSQGTNPGPTGSNPDMAASYMTAYPPVAPQVQRYTGTPMTAPHVVPIFFGSDAMQTSLVTFMQRYMGSSNAWGLLQEYGVGRASNSVGTAMTFTSNALPANVTDGEIKTFLSTNVANSTLPTADANTIYVLFTSAATSVSYGGGRSCTAFGGYHEAVTLATSSKASYAVIPRCSPILDDLTAVLSHELAEVATDPLLASYNQLNDPYALWLGNLSGGEIGDLCEHLTDFKTTELGTVGAISRIWSNTASAAFKNPCVPAPAGPTFFAIPIFTEDPLIQINGVTHSVELATVRVGQSHIAAIRLYSPTTPSPNWDVTVSETPLPTASGAAGTPALSFAWVEAPGKAKVSGSNGSIFHLQISASATGPLGPTTFRLTSTGPTAAGQATEILWVGTVFVTS